MRAPRAAFRDIDIQNQFAAMGNLAPMAMGSDRINSFDAIESRDGRPERGGAHGNQEQNRHRGTLDQAKAGFK